MKERKKGFNELLLVLPPFVVLLVLKLTGVLHWSWWWVTCPLWGYLVVVILVFALLGVVKFEQKLRRDAEWEERTKRKTWDERMQEELRKRSKRNQ